MATINTDEEGNNLLNGQNIYGNTLLTELLSCNEPSSLPVRELVELEVSKISVRNMVTINTDEEGNNYLHKLLRTLDSVYDEHDIETDLDNYFLETPKTISSSLLNGQNIYGNTPLIELLNRNEPSSILVRGLVEFGCDVNIADNLQMTPIYNLAARQFIPSRIPTGQHIGDDEMEMIELQIRKEQYIMKILSDNGADVNKPDIFGRSPLFLVNDIRVIQTLIEYGANVNITDKCGRSLLLASLSMPNYANLARFYSRTMNPELTQHPDMYGSTPLHYAAILRRKDVFDELKTTGGNIDVKDNEGNTPKEIMGCRLPHKPLKQFDVVHYTDVILLDDLSIVVQQPSSASEVCEMLHRPGLGAPSDGKGSETIKTAVVELAQYLCLRIGQLDTRFTCTLFRTGSSTEGTKIGDPNEFDFVFCLDEISKLCDITEAENKKGFAELQATGVISENYQQFFDENGKCNVIETRYAFSRLLKRIVLDKSTWTSRSFIFNGDVSRLAKKYRPALTVKIQGFGYLYKDMEISLDFVPAVRKAGWWPSDIDSHKLDMLTEDIKRKGCLVLLQNPYSQSDTTCRISYSPAEICLMKSLPVHVRDSYRLCKLLRHKSMCPIMQPGSPSDPVLKFKRHTSIVVPSMEPASSPIFFPLFDVEDIITSYMLKNCLFYILSDLRKENLLADLEQHNESEITVEIAVRILEQLDLCSVSKKLPVYFRPNQDDIVKFHFFNQDNLYEFSEDKFIEFRCTRRRAFLKIMLHILGKKLNV